MNGEKDPFDILGEYDPIDPETSPSADSVEGRAMFERITEQTQPPVTVPSTRRWLRPRVALGLAALVGVLAIAMTFAFNLIATTTSVACFADNDVDADRLVIALSDSTDPNVCADPWIEGLFTLPGLAPGEVPPLTSCVNEAGALVVLPTDDPGVCEELGFAAASPSQPEQLFISVAAVVDELDAYIAAVPCRPLEDAADAARRILDEEGLDMWLVEITESTDGSLCASIAIDTPSETLLIVPIPDDS